MEKKDLQRERDGFSLVEIIIVIAIMAILIAVVALAVIPYITSARESKAHDAVNNVQSAFKTCMAKEKFAKQYDALETPVEATVTSLDSAVSGLGIDMERILDKPISEIQTDAISGIEDLNGAKLYVQFKDEKCIVRFSKDGGATAVLDGDGEPFEAK